jgi:opacity protein-like surface antigen
MYWLLIIFVLWPFFVYSEVDFSGFASSVQGRTTPLRMHNLDDGTDLIYLGLSHDRGFGMGGRITVWQDWLGIGPEIYRFQTDLKAQNSLRVGVIQGQPQHVLTCNGMCTPGFFDWGQTTLTITQATLNTYLRYPGEHWRPYLGIGGGISWAAAQGVLPNGQGASDQSTVVQAMAGISYKTADRLSIFVEYRYSYAYYQFGFPGYTGQTIIEKSVPVDHLTVGISYLLW